MKRGVVLLSVASLVLASVASAAVQQGDTELGLGLSFISQNGAGDVGNSDNLEGWVELGYFVTDNVQVGVWANAGWEDEDAAGSDNYGFEDKWYGLGVSGKYHFMPTNLWVPYVGAQIGYSWDDYESDGPYGSDDTYDGIMYGPLAGVRFELNENNDFYAEYQYRLYGGDLDDWYDEVHGLFLGIIHQFK